MTLRSGQELDARFFILCLNPQFDSRHEHYLIKCTGRQDDLERLSLVSFEGKS